MIKKIIRVFLTIICGLAGLLLILGLIIKYEMSWKITNVGFEESLDGKYRVLFQSVGEADWPFGYSHAKVTVKEGDRIIASFREDIADDGAQFRPENYSLEWMKYGLVITFKGSEQPDREVEIFYDGRDSFAGYSDEEIEDILRDRYGIGKVESISKDKDGYAIRADGLDFRGDTDLALHDSYPQELFKKVTEELFPERFGRSLEWELKEGETVSDLVYCPIISMNGPCAQDLNSYCEDICEWLDCCFEKLPYEKAKSMYDATGLIVSAPGYERVRLDFNNMLRPEHFFEDRVAFYNDLYTYLVRYLNYEYTAFGGPVSRDSLDARSDDDLKFTDEISDEVIKQWAGYDHEVSYDFPDGREYALVAVDRALGSSFYVLLAYKEKGNPDSAELINRDPFNQSGGEARFLSFLKDENTGFAALSYSGGSQGMLFKTFDGGKSFEEIILPSPKIQLPTGEYYNPFVMPEEVWEESDTIYLRISQGPDGDHHSKEAGGALSVGIYASKDGGHSFEFVREEPE
ncbi:MAG: hypothetical protein K5931_02810 [Lachnospiraceae bacterium]|nr:hypothetical protein [Lachnospiraceae bacterium]